VIAVDTHTWLWWNSSPELLSFKALDVLQSTERIVVSSVSCYEAASLIERGRVHADLPAIPWLHRAMGVAGVIVAPVDVVIALAAAQLPRDVVRDPIDRLIVATALHHNVPLVTADRKIHAAGVVETIW
jgi:PIN domain nuclease of toxin-antitoxin system